MTRLAWPALVVAAAFVFAACNLNPQPFPPQDNSGVATGDAAVDSGYPPFGNDGGADATAVAPDSGVADAGADSGVVDAAADARADAASDADPDAESDATGD